MSNFFILENGPVASPGVCLICGYSGKDRRYLDPRKDFEFYGTVIFCEECVGSMANDMGFLQPAQARSLENRVEEAERELITLRAAIIQLENVHELLASRSGFAGSSPVSNGGMVLSSDERIKSITEGAVGGIAASGNPSGEGNSKTDDDSGVEGSDDISSLITSADDLMAGL